MRSSKTKVLALMQEGKRLIEAAREIKKDPATLYRWRHTDPDFDSAVSQLVEEHEDARIKAVEETLYDRIMSDRATPTEIIFWLTNRDRARWKNRHSQETLGADGRPVDQIPVTQLQTVAAKIENLNINLPAAELAKLLGLKIPSNQVEK